MKTLLLTIMTAALLQGCVYTTVSNDTFTAKRIACLYPFKTGGFEYNPQTGLITLLDYNTDGGEATAAAVTAAAIKAGLEAAK